VLRITSVYCNKPPYSRSRSIDAFWRSSKVADFGTNRKHLCGFLLVIKSNIGSILHRFGDTVAYRSKNRQNRQFLLTPVSLIALTRGDPFRISGWSGYFQKLKCRMVKKSSFWYNTGVWRRDGQTYGQTDIGALAIPVLHSMRLHSLLCYRAGKIESSDRSERENFWESERRTMWCKYVIK